jgi:hypothetical protein
VKKEGYVDGHRPTPEWRWQLLRLLKHALELVWLVFGLGVFVFDSRQSGIPKGIRCGSVHVLVSPYGTQLKCENDRKTCPILRDMKLKQDTSPAI